MTCYLAFPINFATCICDDSILSGEYDRAWDVESSEFYAIDIKVVICHKNC